MKKIVFMMITGIMLCSCAGLTNISTPNSVALDQGNFKFVKTVSAETRAVYVFSIGGLSSRATQDVVEKLKIAAQLQSNQALADIRIKMTFKLWAFGIVCTRKLTATATVVEFCSIDTNTFKECESQITTHSTIIKLEPKQYTRESAYKRLIEIHEALSVGSVDNIDALKAEVNDIERWYNGFDTIYFNVEQEIRKVKKLLKQTNTL